MQYNNHKCIQTYIQKGRQAARENTANKSMHIHTDRLSDSQAVIHRPNHTGIETCRQNKRQKYTQKVKHKTWR